jgi:hypothetical protein
MLLLPGTNTCLKIRFIFSEDNGQTWTEIAPAGSSDFDPFANPGLNCQGLVRSNLCRNSRST